MDCVRFVVTRLILLTILAALCGSPLSAQEILPDAAPAEPEPSPGSQQAEKAEDSGPAPGTFKRAIQSLTWLEIGPRRLFRSSDDGSLFQVFARKGDTTAGVRFGADGTGTGSGFGPKVTLFDQNFLNRGIDVEVPLVYTYKRYQEYAVKVSVPLVSDQFSRHLSFDLGTGYSVHAEDNFFGLGNESLRSSEAEFRTVTRGLSAGFTARLGDQWTAALHGVYRSVGVTRPTTGFNAQERFAGAAVPGFRSGAALRSLVFLVGRDTEVRDNRSFSGGADQFEASFNDSAGGEFTYWKYRMESQHFFPLTSDGRKVIAARALVETNVARNGRFVPFFDMPGIGSSSTLRGFDSLRFRDTTAMAATLEYRFRIWTALDLGLFVDQAQVAPQLGDLALNAFHTGYGVRLFVWPKPNFPVSLDYGRSNEKWRLHLNVNARF
jgi:hypothetical protein